MNKTSAYSVTQSNSAVNNKCKAVLVVIKNVPKIKKKRDSKVFKSPNNKTSGIL